MPAWNIDRRFDTPENARILDFLREENPSAHSDVAEALLRSAEGVPGVEHYCPDPGRYAFMVLHRSDATIFGLAYGQSFLAYRLPENRIFEARRHGGYPAHDLGESWVRFEPWSNAETLEESRRRLAHWCTLAADASATETSK